MTIKKLSGSDLTSRAKEVQNWKLSEDQIYLSRQFVFNDFIEAFSFMTKIAIIAEKNDHHPEWANIYNKVDIKFTTDDYGGLTELDFKLAKSIDEFYANH